MSILQLALLALSDKINDTEYSESVHDLINESINKSFLTDVSDYIVNSISPVIKIVNTQGTICINRDNYGTDALARFILKNTDCSSSVYIDDKDILDW